MRFSNATHGIAIVALVAISMLSVDSFPKVYAPTTGGNTYTLNAVPASAQEGTTVSLVLSVTLGIVVIGSTTYSFRFYVRDPAGSVFQSQDANKTVPSGQTQFTVLINYTSPQFPGVNDLAGTYAASVNEIAPSPGTNIANCTFVLTNTDNSYYQRTQTVNVQASGYNASETAYVTIETHTTSTIVFFQTVTASPTGVVTTSWRIPPNATIDNYLAFINGTTTHKSPADNDTFAVKPAQLGLSGICPVSLVYLCSLQSIYQRTNTMSFYFQPTYPDLTVPTTGVGLLTLTRPSGTRTTLTATYASSTQTFNATYDTTPTNQTGAWTLSLAAKGYSDAYGNTGPATAQTISIQLNTASLFISVSTNTNVAVGQQLGFNVTVTYPDGTTVPSAMATVHAFLIYSGTPAINNTIPLVYDSNLGHWVGTYTAKSADTGGLWSLIVLASDSATPSNAGSASRAITIQNNGTPGSPSASFPLFYFEILAGIIAGLLVTILLVFRRRRTGHTSLKIDLDAVHSEAGRIENQDFFKNIKEQLHKDPDEQP